MGNKDTKPASSFSDWEKIDTDDGIDIYRNKKDNQLAEKRAITIDPHYDLNDQLKIYHMRQHNRDALVRAFGAENLDKKSSSEGLCSGHKKVFVLTQKMPYRLSQLPQLTFPESLLFLRQSLRAYSKVFKNYGPIHISNKLIGINDFGQVKCWVNENWALNHPDHDFPSLQSTKLQDLTKEQFLAYGAKYRDQTEMVHNIIAVIQQKCQQGKFPRAFSEQVQQHSSSFKKLQLYLQDFIRYNQIFIPPKINYQTVFVSKYETRLAEQHQLSGQNLNQNQNNQNNQNNQIEINNNQNNQNKSNAQINNNQLNGNSQNAHYLGYSQQQALIQSQQNQQASNYGYTQNIQSNQASGSTNVPLSWQNQGNFGYSSQPSGGYQSFTSQKNTQTVINKPYQPQTTQIGALTSSINGPINTNTTGNYTVTKTTTTSYGGIGGISSNSAAGSAGNANQAQSSLYSPFTVNNNQAKGAQNSLYPANTGSSSPWIVTQSVYKTVQPSQNQYSSSYSQYSSSIGGGNQYSTSNNANKDYGAAYNFGGIYGGVESSSNYQSYKPSSYTNITAPEVTKYNAYTPSSNFEPSYGSSAQKGSTYSFDGKNDFSSKFGGYSGGYNGSGYSNTLTKYQTTVTTNNVNSISEASSKNKKEETPSIQGNYLQAFTSLLQPALKANNQDGSYTVTTTEKRYTSNVSNSNLSQGQKQNRQNINVDNSLQNIAKQVERPSSQANDTIAVNNF